MSLRSNIPNLLLLIRPKHFGFNSATAKTNRFQRNESSGLNNTVVRKEFDEVIAIIEKNNLTCTVFEDKNEPLPDAVFPNNWISSSPEGIVTVYPMLTENRQKEVREDIIEWTRKAINSTALIDLRSEIETQRYLEGTGSMIFDHFDKKVYACESPRTNIKLFEEYCNQINYTPFSFESVDLNQCLIYHTNVMMSLAQKYCIVNLDSVENQMERSFLKQSILKSGRKIIPISFQQMNCFAANVFEVLDKNGQSCLLMSETAYQSLTADQLKIIRVFSKIIRVDVPTIEKIGGGGIRCMVAGLFTA